MFKFLLYAILTLFVVIPKARTLSPEDLEDLLPKIPRDKNETIAAVVQDPVVKDAVKQAATNGSLNGLVVKKNVFLMPASDPNKVLSQRQQVLIVPTEHLEDVRRNITEAKKGVEEIDESGTMENETVFEGKSNESTLESNQSDDFNEDFSNEGKMNYEILKNTIAQESATPKGISVPIVAVIDPSKVNVDEKVKSSVVALLPNPDEKDVLANQINFLGKNREQILTEAQTYIDGMTSPSLVPENWKINSETPANSDSSIQESDKVAQKKSSNKREAPKTIKEELFLPPIVVPRFEIVSPILRNNVEYPRDVNDMDVAEDIIFRPLFRYRQEAEERSKYRDNYRRRNSYNYNYYNRYRPYNYDYNSYSNRDYYNYYNNRRSVDY